MKVLIVRTGAFGDVLHALPAVAALRAAAPDALIDWVIDPRWSPLLANTAGDASVIHRTLPAETKAWSAAPFSPATLRSVLELRRSLQASNYDLVVDLQGTLRSSVIARLSGCPHRSGFADPREAAAAWMYTERLPRLGAHIVDQNTALLATAAGVALRPTAFALPHEASEDLWVAHQVLRDRPLCLLAPTAGWPAKQWPVAHFAELARQLTARGLHVVVNASQQNDPIVNAVVLQSGGTARPVVSSVAGLVALVRRAAIVVGGDSGPVHLAAALRIPLIALFGPTDPARNGPWPAGTVLRDATSITSYKRSSAPDPGLARITVDQVLAAIEAARLRK